MNETKRSSILIVGAGAAGLMTAVSALEHGAKDILILDAAPKAGLKISMCGGGRCNVSNAQLEYNRYFGESPNAIKKVVLQFPPEKVVRFFEQEGVPLYIEPPWHKYFPVDNRSFSILNTLLKKISLVPVHPSVKVHAFHPVGKYWTLETDHGAHSAERLVLACGGLSYPETGSDGTLWKILEDLDVPLKTPYPALTPLFTSDIDFHSLAGIALPCELFVKKGGKTVFAESSPLLFTHFGLSGPSILNASHWFTQKEIAGQCSLEISFLPGFSSSETEAEMIQISRQRPNLRITSYLAEKLPKRLAETLSKRACSGEKKMTELSREERKSLLAEMFHCRPSIQGHGGYKMAEITGGGVPFSELDIKTMGFKKHPGLYAVGELVNVHGVIGGYNLQWAWSSGWVCGKALASSWTNGNKSQEDDI